MYFQPVFTGKSVRICSIAFRLLGYFQVGIQGIALSRRIAINKMTRRSPLHVTYAFMR